MKPKTIFRELHIAARQHPKEREYWFNRLSNATLMNHFPYNRKKTDINKRKTGYIEFTLPADLFVQLLKLSKGSDYSLSIILLASVIVLLGKYTGEKDVVVGVPIYKQEFKGNFINTVLPIRNQSHPRMTFKELLLKVGQGITEATENQYYPMEVLLEELNLNDASPGDGFPLFDAAVLLENIHNKHDIQHTLPNIMFSFLRTEETISGKVMFNRTRYEKDFIEKIIAHLRNLFHQVLYNVDIFLGDIDILSDSEKKRLLWVLNDTRCEYPADKTLHELFAEQASRIPDHIALLGENPKHKAPPGEISKPLSKKKAGAVKQITNKGESYSLRAKSHELIAVTYKELNEKSNQLAHVLRQKVIKPDTIVGVMLERSIEMIMGIFGIIKAGAAYLSLDPDYPQERINYMLTDSNAEFLVTAPGLAEKFEKLSIINCQLLMVNEKPSDSRRLNISPKEANSINNYQLTINNLQLEYASLAYIIYTSGTTGRPKGVMIEHRNVVQLLFNDKFLFGFDSNDVWTMFHSYCFDFSVWEMYGSLLYGGKLVLIPATIAKDPRKYLDILHCQQVTVLNQTPSAFYNLAHQELTHYHHYKHLCLKYVIFGGEALKPAKLNEWKKRYPKTKLINMFGITETTVHATYKEITAKEIALGISNIGKPIPNMNAYVMDRDLKLLPIGIPGELYLSGDGLGRGYLNRPELTAERFLSVSNRSYRSYMSYISKKFYKTGDLVRFIDNGEMEYLGRIDHQVKIRGFRIELGEIESQLLKADNIKEAVVLSKEDEGKDRFLCAYVVPGSTHSSLTPDFSMLRQHLTSRLPDYMIPSYFVSLEKFPLTPNGKIDVKALPDPVIEAGEDYVPPSDEIQEQLVEIWYEVLDPGKGSSSLPATATQPLRPLRIGINDNFFELGGHSLKATRVIYQIEKSFQVIIELREFFTNPTIAELARRIRDSEILEYRETSPIEQKEYYELSYAQRRLWVLCQFEEDSSAYNIPMGFILLGKMDTTILIQTVQTLVDRHESLRTVFININGEPKQKILNYFKFRLQQQDLQNLDAEMREEKARKIYSAAANYTFHLEQGPLFLFKLVPLEEEKYLLIFNIHHIISDGWSQGVIFNELVKLYNAFCQENQDPLPPLQLQYKDYTLWHNALVEKGHFKRSQRYWLEKFKDRPNGIELPLDHPRKPIQTFNGHRVTFNIDGETTSQWHRLANQQGATLFMGLLSVLKLFLYRCTGQGDMIIGSPIAGRKQPALETMIGFLVNTLVYRVELKPGESFIELLARVKEETLACYEYQDYPFDVLVERLELDRDLSQSPLFNVMLAHNNAETLNTQLKMQGVTIAPYAHIYDYNMSKFDLIFFMDETEDQIVVSIEYNSDLFNRSTIERMSLNFLTLLRSVINHPKQPVTRLDYIAKSEYEKITREFNDNKINFPGLTIQELFENQVKKSPDKTSVVDMDKMITYDELNKRANQLAHVLRENFGAQPNGIIGISMDRCIEMVMVILGIIKAGAGYAAIDPNYPQERVLQMLNDSCARLLVIDQMRPHLLANYQGKIIDIYTHWPEICGKPVENPPLVNNPADVLYVIYTSGSTGTPNGAMLSQGILSNLIQWQHKQTSIDSSLRCLQFTSINFCVSFQEIMVTLTAGGQVHLIGDIERQDIDYLMEFLSRHKIEILFLPFSYLNFLFNESSRWGESFRHNLNHIITAGEQLKVTGGLKKFLDLNPGIKLHNHYGSSEMHVVTSYTLDSSTAGLSAIPPAGKPVANTRVYILDDHYEPVSLGVWGQLFVAGSWEVLGYINNVELTNWKLMKHRVFSADPAGGKRLYRSGDLGRWLEDGNIELKGRKDLQVKVRGFRVEPGEIESQILNVDGVKDCVVVVRDDKQRQKALFAYVVIENIGINEIKNIIGNVLPQYMIPQFIVLDSLPLMPNGKVDREKLPEPCLVENEAIIAPRDNIEEKLVEIWGDLLEIEKKSISIDSNFFQLGGHSLKATSMTSRIHKTFNVKVPLVEIFKNPVLAELSRFIKKTAKEKYKSIQPAENKEYHVMSSAQQRLYIIQQMDVKSTAYNMPTVIHLGIKVEKEKLANTFRQLIKRHEVLRTSLEIINEEPVQCIHENVDFEIQYDDLTQWSNSHQSLVLDEMMRDFVRPFDLSQPLLMRVKLVKSAGEKYLLLLDMHHIITDAVSYEIMERDFVSLYNGEPLPALPLQYKDFAEWQNSPGQQEKTLQQETYWLKEYEGKIPLLNMPTDYARPEKLVFSGGRVLFEINRVITGKIRALALRLNVTPMMFFLSLYKILLSKYTRQQEIVVGTVIAGRRHTDLENIIGFFVNMLAIKTNPNQHKTFMGYLKEVKEKIVNAFDNQEYQFEELVSQLNIERHSGRHPLVNVIFAFQENRQQLSPTQAKSHRPGHESLNWWNVSHFDLMLHASAADDSIHMAVEYSSALFKKSTIEELSNDYLDILNQVVINPDIPLKDIKITLHSYRSASTIIQDSQEEWEL